MQKSKNLRKLSHTLSWALRHAAPELGLTMAPDGFVPLNELLQSKHPKMRQGSGASGWTIEDVRTVVKNCEKQRFKLEERPASDDSNEYSTSADSNPILFIRANQGHSIKGIDPTLLLRRLRSEELSTMTIVHGTYPEPWESIRRQGLKRMNRNHIHFASGLPGANGVISGMRKSSGIYIFVDGARCADAGILFYKSDNGVILTAGVNEDGILPVEYFSRVQDASGNILLDQRSSS